MKKLILLSFVLLAAWSCSKDTASGGTTTSAGPGQGGGLARFAVVGGHLFAVDNTTLKVFNITFRENPIFVSNHELNVVVETIFPRDDSTLFIGTTTGMFIYDISSAPQLTQLSRYDHIVSCDPVVADHEYAYVTLHSDRRSRRCFRNVNRLDIVDIRNLTDPFPVNEFPLVKPLGLGIYGDTLLVCDTGLKIFNVSDPENLSLINAIEDIDAVDIIPNGRTMIIATSTGLEQYDYFKGELNFLSKL